jgi:hypothetical protein
MPDGRPEEAHISCKPCRGDGDNAVRVRRTGRYRRRTVNGFGARGWPEDYGIGEQSGCGWRACDDRLESHHGTTTGTY